MTITHGTRVLTARIWQTWRSNKGWLWTDVLVPLLLTRFALLFVGWFSQAFTPNPESALQVVVERGWYFSPYRLLDIWGRWDSGWYMSIALEGYHLLGDITTTQSNIAFFPLYPLLVRLLILWVPASVLTLGIALLAGVIISNVLLLGALILLHRLVATNFDPGAAQRTVLYLLLFPTAFFFSAFYTEATFLFLSVAAFFAASKKAWAVSCILAGLAAMTKFQGVLLAAPLIWMYAESLEWRLNRVRWEAAWFLLIPGGLLIFLVSIYPLTGNLLAPFVEQQASWHHHFTAFLWDTVLKPPDGSRYLGVLEQLTSIAIFLAAILAWKWLPSKAYSIYLAVLLLLVLVGGNLSGMNRYAVVMFPAFIVLALLGRSPTVDRFVIIVFAMAQAVLMAIWSQFYYVG